MKQKHYIRLRKTLCLIGFLALVLMISRQSHAQFFKKLANKVSEKITTEKNKDAEPSGSNTSPDMARKTGSLSADYQLMMEGSGPDLFLEYQLDMEGKQSQSSPIDIHMNMTVSSATGQGRSETSMEIPIIGKMNMVTLTDVAHPRRIVLLNERKKQYSIIEVSQPEGNNKSDSYTVKRVGEEKLHGLHCLHVIVTDKDGQDLNLWTTTEIPGYQRILALYSKSQRMGSDHLWKTLKDAGAAGLMVKLKVDTKGGASVMQLTKIRQVSVPKSTFEIPADYKEKKGGWVKRYKKQMKL